MMIYKLLLLTVIKTIKVNSNHVKSMNVSFNKITILEPPTVQINLNLTVVLIHMNATTVGLLGIVLPSKSLPMPFMMNM
jgi:hypothetical protein